MKLGHWDYGYVKKGQTFGSSREELINLVWCGAGLSLVWTPDTPQPVPPETVPFLFDAFHKKENGDARKAIVLGLLCLLFAVVLALGLRNWVFLNPNIVIMVAVLILSHGIWLKLRSLHYTQLDAANDASYARYLEWANRRDVSGYTLVVAACLVVGSFTQLFNKDATAQFGLVKAAVRNGEVWRLFTSILVHANFSHVFYVLLVLIPFSKTIDRTVHRSIMPAVFLLTALMGNVVSVVLRPSTTSIGASGGLFGLLGFVAITVWLDEARTPRKQFVHVMELVAALALVGPLGLEYFDNAAHLGGFLGGVLLGWLFFKQNEQAIEKREKLFNFAGLASLVLLCLIAGFTVYRMVR